MSDASASRNETRLHLVAPAGERSGEGSVREQLIAAAEVHFARYGYAKTTLVDLARAVGFSKTYFYRFFASKQEIG
ncbi:TetR family transcriptional regulator, partial [Acinetobacter baumannii]